MPKGKANKRYSGEFKQLVVEDVRNNKLGYNEAMRKYGIAGRSKIQQWERICLEEGPEGLNIERRGRGSKGRPPKLDKQVEEDLITENQRLKAEVDYLKNLQALVLEDERRQHKKRR